MNHLSDESKRKAASENSLRHLQNTFGMLVFNGIAGTRALIVASNFPAISPEFGKLLPAFAVV
ncbi:MAG TPA: hypothetical protein VEV17_14420 [Bryobacteraceae bacterium]|nr:hypothetical protein [Bryobacteraceae bacterium]